MTCQCGLFYKNLWGLQINIFSISRLMHSNSMHPRSHSIDDFYITHVSNVNYSFSLISFPHQMSRIPIASSKKRATKQVLLTWIGIFSTLLAFRLPSFNLLLLELLFPQLLFALARYTHTHRRVVSLLSGARAPFYVSTDFSFTSLSHAALNGFLKGKSKQREICSNRHNSNLKFTLNLTYARPKIANR